MYKVPKCAVRQVVKWAHCREKEVIAVAVVQVVLYKRQKRRKYKPVLQLLNLIFCSDQLM